MPTPPAVPGVLRIAWKQTLGSDLDVLTRLFFSYTGTAPSNATCVSIASAAWLAYSNYLTPLLIETAALTACDVVDLTSATAGAGEYVATSAGTRSGGILSGGTACLVNASIARRYRGGKPRTYWPFFTSTELSTEQTWNSTALSEFVTQWDDFMTHMLAISESGCVLSENVSISLYEGFVSAENPITHRWRNLPTYRTGAIPVDPILSQNMNPRPASQRRRNLHKT
jgi:hypothetical protein